MLFLAEMAGRGPREEKRRRAQARRRRDGGAERSGGSGAQQHRLELAALQGGLGGISHQGEVGHQGGGLLLRVVLPGRGQIDVLPGHQLPQVPGRGGQPSLVEGASRMGRQLRRWALAARVTVVSAMPQASLPRVLPVQGAMISRSSRPLGPMGSASLLGGDHPVVADALHLPHQVVGGAKPGVGVCTTSETMGMTWSYRAFTASQGLHGPVVGAEGAAHRESHSFMFHIAAFLSRYHTSSSWSML